LLALVTVPLLPMNAAPAHAATREDYAEYFRELTARSNEYRSSRSFSRERYSSATQRAIRELDDDIVEDLPVPVLLGISPSQINSDFGDPRGDGSREHEGQDLIAPRGAFIASPTDAVVIRTGDGSSSGIYVYTMNPGGESFRYMHLDAIADGVKAGTVLEAGDLIGYVGDSGNAKGGVTHLHFEIRDDGEAIDPYPRLTKEFTIEQRIAALTQVLEALIKEQKKRD